MTHTLDALARAIGIQESYTDIWGKENHVPGRTKKGILSALGVEAAPDCPEVIVVTPDTSCERVIHGQPVRLPPLSLGYHTWDTGTGSATVIAAPPRCWLPDALADGRRIWGISAQLYGLRSQSNWGMGDFSDLAWLAEQAARMGADVIGINPLHASYPHAPERFSPYAPSNREFLNHLYIDVARLPGCGVDGARLEAVRQTPLVDYPAVAALKKQALEDCFAHFRQHGDKTDFERFRQEMGAPLLAQATFDALSEHFPDTAWYGDWPPAYRSPHSAEVAAFRRDHAERVDFYCWLQYTADRQLAEARHRAREAGMLLGLYRDLAVGSGLAGAETWQHPHRFVRGVSVGAPPDLYNLKGQDWGLPPFNPLVMRQEGMRPLIDLLRANMRHAGALRIDHAFGLSRLFWVPEGMSPAEGAYVTYPFEAMLAVLRVESHLNRCLVIGEDLGTFPPGYKEKAAASGVLSYRLLYFERGAGGHFVQPEDYPAQALASISTHDLPPLAGWRDGTDIDARETLGLYPSPDMPQKERAERRKDVKRLQEALAAQNLEGDMQQAAQRFLARSPAMLVLMQLEDVLGLQEQANLPATVDEHPNWRRKLPVSVEELCAAGSPLATLAPEMNRERHRPAPSHPIATYRLQLHKDFTFHDAAATIPYLHRLGVSHVYTSPITTARRGSTHGYDVVDHTRLNPELGGEKGFDAFRTALEKHGLRHLLDIVPNHMGVDASNRWWQDVLAHGEQSPYARYFDIDWREKLLLPVLGKPYEEALAAGELGVVHEDGHYHLAYYGHRFALNPGYHSEARQAMERQEALEPLIDRQCYRLAHWREAAHHLNYRRFFEINDLAGVRVEEPAVFESVHRLILDLLDKGALEGLRIDHIDGLADPAAYCRALQRRAGPNRYIVAEKILGEGEELPQDWPIAGTTGYDALNHINALFVQPEQEAEFIRIYRDFTGDTQDFAQVLREAKRQVLRESFGSELKALTTEACRLVEMDGTALTQALSEVIVHFPVYRGYATAAGMSGQDRRYLRQALDAARLDSTARPVIERLFESGDEAFLRRFQQLTGPAMAKGLEDTSFYRYHRFISLNEVGGNPGRFGLTAEEFHHLNRQRQKLWPQTMIATATHDTKRGEDMRARLNALSALPQEWEQAVNNWHRLCPLPLHPCDSYFLYQTLVGSWPLELMEPSPPPEALEHYHERLCAYMTKALREGKQRSSWLVPDEGYEKKACDSIGQLLHHPDFLPLFLPFIRKVAYLGMCNSLAQLALKLTLPGVPDIYQGTEFWDFSLVDPDNRRPVDYATRRHSLSHDTDWHALAEHWADGRIKQHLLHALLLSRQHNHALYAYGEYIPLAAVGERTGHILAYARRLEDRMVVVILSLRPHMADTQRKSMIRLPVAISSAKDIVTGGSVTLENGILDMESLNGAFPIILEA